MKLIRREGSVHLSKLKVVELFSGIGAWSKALQNLGVEYEVVLAADFDEYAVVAYNALHDTNFHVADITQLNEKEVPDCDIIFYSPPCQSFSVAGKQEGFDDHRGILFFDALRVIKEKKPKYAIMENVKGLTQKKFEGEFRIMQEELAKAGYKNYWKILNAKDYSVPQNRERVFLISIREDIDFEFNFPKPTQKLNNLIEYLEDDAQLPILHNIYGGFKEKSARVFEEYSPTIRTSAGGGHIPSVVVKTATYKKHNQVEVDFVKKEGIQGYKIASKINGNYKLVKDERELAEGRDYVVIRSITTLEAFRLMGFTDSDYELVKQSINDKFYKGKNKSNTRLYRLAGNSIVVNVIEELLKCLPIK